MAKRSAITVFIFFMLISVSVVFKSQIAVAGQASAIVKVYYCYNNDYSCTAQGEPYCCYYTHYYDNFWVDVNNAYIHY